MAVQSKQCCSVQWLRSFYFCGRHYQSHFFRRYAAIHNIPVPLGYFEKLDARLTGKRTDSREKSGSLWRRQPDLDLEHLRVRALTLTVASYVI